MTIATLPTKPAPSWAPPPKDLAAPEALFWTAVIAEFALVDSPALAVLERACRALQLARECREKVEADGLLMESSQGTRAHPLIRVGQDADKAFLAAIKALALDIEPLRDGPGRPPAMGGR
jgi:phage terminase small subunit